MAIGFRLSIASSVGTQDDGLRALTMAKKLVCVFDLDEKERVIDISTLAQGFYVYKLTSDHQVLNCDKLVIIR